MGQVETDELYIGIDKRGVHYALPIQAKGGRDKIGVIQIEQDFAVCERKLKGLLCRPIAAQFMNDDVIALFEFGQDSAEIRVVSEKHYKFVHPNDLTPEDLNRYYME